MPSDSWPALHGRPVLRRTVAIGLVIFVSVLAALAVRGVNALTVGRGAIETDRDRAELLAGLHPSQHPGAGRYYVPVGAVYTHTADGLPVAYLHYRLAGGHEVGVGDFLRTYDLAAPGAITPLPADLAEALGGDEPAEAREVGVPDPFATPSSPSSPVPTASASADPSALPGETPAAEPEPTTPEPTGHIAPATESESEAESEAGSAAETDPATATEQPLPAPEDTPSPTPTPTADPTPTPVVTPTPARARRIYIAPDPAGLPGAADIYVRATG
ncbi:hypothetical protein ACFVVU_10970 [Kitasatospora sp. NPDC057965]|uniref:hypothetical protein n=1 Tax=Kitasatospora sp. NPDC057965 TaxID=3346291 RepID=UPI0036DDBF77